MFRICFQSSSYLFLSPVYGHACKKMFLICSYVFPYVCSLCSFVSHFIISNPPYIPSDTISSLQVDVAQYEPHTALDGGPDGLSFYRYLLETAPSLLAKDGEMLLEIGFDQQADLSSLKQNYPVWKSSTFLPDLQGNDRVWKLGLSQLL